VSGINKPALPEPARRSGQQMWADGETTAFFDCYDPAQMLAYGEACARAKEAEITRLRAEVEALRTWRAAIDEALALSHLNPTSDTEPANVALNRLLAWHQAVALDPAVSAGAQALIERGRGEALRAGADNDCPACEGSGIVRLTTSHLGPDDYDYDDMCEACAGSGSANPKTAIESLPYSLHSARGFAVIKRAAVLRIVDAHLARLKLTAPPPSAPAAPAGWRTVGPVAAVAWHYPDGKPCTITWPGEDEQRIAPLAKKYGLVGRPLYAPSLETDGETWRVQSAALSPADQLTPIDMVLHCPNCGKQHVDAPEPGRAVWGNNFEHPIVEIGGWSNPPHRSHLCHSCGTIWRPADLPTNGVERTKTKGKADTWVGKAPLAAPADQPDQPARPEGECG